MIALNTRKKNSYPISPAPHWLRFSPEVEAGIKADQPVVALESTVISHGLPRPINLETARRMENEVQKNGGVPATIAVLNGEIRVGLAPDELETFSLDETTQKINRRDIPSAVVKGHSGGTTVSATMFIAHAAGIRIFATGGIGGVHRGSEGDISTDLIQLATTPLVVVCAGAKAILDLPRTLEWLETAGVPVVGWKTDELPAFYSRSSSLPTSTRVNTAEEASELISTSWELGMESGLLICVPCPEDAALTEDQMERAINEAEKQAVKDGITGKALTPYMLSKMVDFTDGASLVANLALLKENANVAAEIATTLAKRRKPC